MDRLTAESLREGLLFYILLIACLGLRSYAQAWSADKLGDPTPRDEGRLTLNLLPHMDLFGSVILPLISIFYLGPALGGSIAFFLAWTKPMPINPANFVNPRRDYLLSQLSSTGMSVLLALLSAVIGGLAYGYNVRTAEVFGPLIAINAMLIVLDLLPLPPLPGGMLLRHLGLISEDMYHQVARWGGLILLVAINIPILRYGLSVMIMLAQAPFIALFNSLRT